MILILMCYYLFPVDDEEEEKRKNIKKKGRLTTRSKGSSLQALAKDLKGGTV